MACGLAAAQRVCNSAALCSRRSGLFGPTHERRLVAPFLRSQAAAYFLLPLSAACWAGNHVVARAAGGHVPPASLAVARWLLIVLIVLPFALPHLAADWPKLKRNAGIMLLLAAVGGGAFGTLQFVALHFTTALNMGVVGSVAPAFIVAASWLLFRDRLSWLQLLGVMISLSGVLAIVSRLDLGTPGEPELQRRRSHHHRQHGAVGDLYGVPAAAARHPSDDLHAGHGGGRRPRQSCRSPCWSTRSTIACNTPG